LQRARPRRSTRFLTIKPSSAVSGNNFYFKAGDYDQNSTGSKTTISSTIRSTVEVSSVSAVHK
jgi:hypothetical protein